MSELKLNPEVDIDINVEDLDGEFRRIGPLIYRYHKEMSNIQKWNKFISKSKRKI